MTSTPASPTPGPPVSTWRRRTSKSRPGSTPPDPGDEPEPGVAQSPEQVGDSLGDHGLGRAHGVGLDEHVGRAERHRLGLVDDPDGALLAQPAGLAVGGAVAGADRQEVEVGALGDGLVHDLGPTDHGDRLVVRERQQRAEPAPGAVRLDHP